jgi:hypothetical protein
METIILKLDKLNAEIDKAKGKLAASQARLRELERRRTELENAEIVAVVRSMSLSPKELREFLDSRGSNRIGGAMAANGGTEYDEAESAENGGQPGPEDDLAPGAAG